MIEKALNKINSTTCCYFLKMLKSKRYLTFLNIDYLDKEWHAYFKRLVCSHIPYLHKSSAHPFRGFLGPKNRVHIRIDGALDTHAKSETTISLSVGSL